MIVAEGPPRPGLCPSWWRCSCSVLLSEDGCSSHLPTLGFPPSRWRKWPGHRPKGDVAVRRGSQWQPRDSAARAGLCIQAVP